MEIPPYMENMSSTLSFNFFYPFSTTDSDFRNWDNGEPNNGGLVAALRTEDCALITGQFFLTVFGKWNDNFCGDKFNYICKRKARE